jgi:ParB-like chromosome segregation protein Spo0J
MLANLSPEVRECLSHAEDCAEQAKIEPNPAIQRDFIEMERRWLELARNYQLFERLQTFAHQEQKRGELSDRLEQLKHKLSASG